MKLTLPALSCLAALTLSGCASVQAPTNINSFSNITDLAVELYRSAEVTPFGASLEKAGLNPNSSSYKDEVKKQWWATSCPVSGEEDATVADHQKKFAEFCTQKGGQYSEGGFCWKNKTPIFYASVVFGTITARRCGNGSPITYHIIEPTGSYDDFTNWFKNLAQYRNGQVGDVNVYKGQYIDNIYYWTSQKPRIFFSSEDLKILTPAAYEAYERAINSRIAALQASRPRADTNMMAKWKREFPVGTRICQSARSSGAPVLIPGIKIKGVLIGYVEAYADTKVKIRAVEHTAINNFKENTFWIFPDNKWYLCE